LLIASRFEEAAAFARKAWQHDFGNSEQMANLVTFGSRVDIDLGIAGAEAILAQPAPPAADLYQAH
ncbi:MAG: hypothetical protein GWN87_32330, partial [Desulfuromonadales bacterium]|nr:hypothetical protein [Desulfuromonadales bacterium]